MASLASRPRKGLMSPSPSVVDDDVSVASIASSGEQRTPSYEALRQRESVLTETLARLAQEHKRVTIQYAALLRRQETHPDDATCTSASSHVCAVCGSGGDDKTEMLLRATSAVEALAGTVEDLKATQKRLEADLEASREVNDALARYVAKLEVTNDCLSLELDAIIRQRPSFAVSSPEGTAGVPEDTSKSPATRFDTTSVLAESLEKGSRVDVPLLNERTLLTQFFPSALEQSTEDRANALLAKGRWLRLHFASRGATML